MAIRFQMIEEDETLQNLPVFNIDEDIVSTFYF